MKWNKLPQRPRLDARAAADGQPAELVLYGDIGDDDWGGISSDQVLRALAELGPVEELTVRINSRGGDIFHGMAIYEALRGLKAQVTTRVEGVAASIASVIMLAGSRVAITPTAHVMIHRAWTITLGDAPEHDKQSAVLKKLDDAIAGVYLAKVGGERATLDVLMTAETWFSAEEAIAIGLADELAGEAAASEPAAQLPDLSIFARAPRVATPATPATSPTVDELAQAQAAAAAVAVRLRILELDEPADAAGGAAKNLSVAAARGAA